MTSLITGGAGALGAAVVRILLEKEEKLAVFDLDRSTRRLDNVADKVEFVHGDLRDFSHVLNAVKRTKPSVIYHLAGMPAASADRDPAGALHANVLGTFHVLEAARLFNVPKLLFSSSIGTYAWDLQEKVISDDTLQRPQLFYGATKLFCEHMGLFFKRKYGLDFRGVRFPAFVGPGVEALGAMQFSSRVIEECGRGNPYTIRITPETKIPIIYVKDAARAIIMLGEALLGRIKTVNYVLAGISPTPSARDLTDVLRVKVPGAQIHFKPDPKLQHDLDRLFRPIDDSHARNEWDWQPLYDQERMVDDFLAEFKLNPQRYDR